MIYQPPQMTNTSSGTYFAQFWPDPEVYHPDWQGIANAFVELGFWERTAYDLMNGVTDRIWLGRGRAMQRFFTVFGRRRLAVDRAQRVAMCGLMMAMCGDDANAAMGVGREPHL